MKDKTLMLVAGVVLLVSGFTLTGWGPMLVSLYGAGDIPNAVASDKAAMTVWTGLSFVRLFGTALAGLGLVSLFTHNMSSLDARKAISRGLFAATVLILIVATVQQIAIWSTPIGWVTVGLLVLIALGYGSLGIA
jgi:hypothetical protein